MPKYRIISQPNTFGLERESRGFRLPENQARLLTIVEADCLAQAAADARDTEPHREHRITSVEEIHAGVYVNNAQITASLTSDKFSAGIPLIDPQDFATEDSPLYGQDYFGHTVQLVVAALHDSNLVPGLNISVLNNPGDEPYAMVEIFDEARGIYLSRGTELRKLTDDRKAVGWDGVLAIARELIWFSNDLH